MARRSSMPSFLSAQRARRLTLAAAGTLTLATAVSAATAILPSAASAAPATASAASRTVYNLHGGHAQTARTEKTHAAGQVDLFDQVRFSLGEHQHEYQVAAVKTATAAARAAEAKAAAKTAAEKTAAEKTAAEKTAAARHARATAEANSARRAAGTPSGTPEQIAQQMLGQYGWPASQFSCLQPLWYHESGWNPSAENPGSGAFGIPQSLPASQMASAGADWRTNPATQIKWGLTYIQGRYGSPCGAWAHEQADNWY